MVLYGVFLRCELEHIPGACPHIDYCNESGELIVDTLVKPDPGSLNKQFKVPDCSRTGCKRWFGSTVIRYRINPWDKRNKPYPYLTIDDLIEKKL